MGRWLIALPPLIFVALAVTFYMGMNRDGQGELPSTRIGQIAPDLPRLAVDGTSPLGDSLSEGELTIVNFWASWCPPCRAEHPRLNRMAEAGVRIVGVNFNDREEDAAAYLRDDGNPFAATAVDPAGRASLDWGVVAPPETFIVDANGVVLFRFTGPLIGSDYEQRFLPQLEAAGLTLPNGI